MPKKTKPKAVCDGGTPLTPITAKVRRKLDKSIKKKYDRFRRRYPEVHGKVVDFSSFSCALSTSVIGSASNPVETGLLNFSGSFCLMVPSQYSQFWASASPAGKIARRSEKGLGM
jgi:hypothetical protein